jgi:UDP:flavonoid glycosyltransferase YjiC (YdhE family)
MDPVRGGARFLLREIVAPNLRHSYHDLRDAVRDADLMVSHSMCAVAPLVAASTGIAWVSGIVSPMFLQSEYDPPSLPLLPALAHVPVLGKFAVRGWNRWLRNWLAQPLAPLAELRRELGLPPGESPLFADQHSPRRVLGLFSPALAPPQPDWPPQTRATGFCLYDRAPEHPMSTQLCSFLRGGEPPILFTLGASSALSPGDFWAQSVAAVKQSGRRAIFAIGQPSETLCQQFVQHLPDNILVLPYVPLSSVLPHCAAIVHHGGIGTIALSLQAGKPMLIMPHSQDQPDNALRARRIGVARLLSRRQYQSERIARELTTLLSDASYTRRATGSEYSNVQRTGHANRLRLNRSRTELKNPERQRRVKRRGLMSFLLFTRR